MNLINKNERGVNRVSTNCTKCVEHCPFLKSNISELKIYKWGFDGIYGLYVFYENCSVTFNIFLLKIKRIVSLIINRVTFFFVKYTCDLLKKTFTLVIT